MTHANHALRCCSYCSCALSLKNAHNSETLPILVLVHVSPSTFPVHYMSACTIWHGNPCNLLQSLSISIYLSITVSNMSTSLTSSVIPNSPDQYLILLSLLAYITHLKAKGQWSDRLTFPRFTLLQDDHAWSQIFKQMAMCSLYIKSMV